MFYRVTLLDLIIAKIVGDEPLTKDDIPVFLSHAELIASTFVDQCKIVLKLTSEQHADDEVRGQFLLKTQMRERTGMFSNSARSSMSILF